jgi:tetratricopeptide (TPR) repeat protein
MIRKSILILLFLMPVTAWSHGDLHDRIDDVSMQLADDKQKPELYLKRGKLYLQDGNFHEALHDFRKSLKLDPALHVVHYHLGEAYLAMGRSDAAEQHTRLFLKSLGPETYGGLSRGYDLLGKIYQKRNKYLDAAKAYEQSLQNNTQPAPIDYLQAAEAYVKSGQKYQQQAIRLLDQGIDRLGPVVTLQEAAIELEMLSGSYDAALARVETFRSQGISEPNICYRQASIMSTARRFEEAQKYYKKSLTEIENLPAHRQASKSVQKLRLLIEEGMSKQEVMSELAGKPTISPDKNSGQI